MPAKKLQPVKVGVIGTGTISAKYLEVSKQFEILDVVGCADILVDRARARADEYGVPWAGTPDELLAREDVELVVNLTIPKAHAGVARAALDAGKSVYNEKPLATLRADGKKLLETAKKNGLRVGCAPDTFLGGGIQTCRKLIDEGAIGEPVAAAAFFTSHGPESWHPDPDFYYQPGAGPLFDMGPYYLTTLVNLIGPMRRVSGSARVTFPERLITSKQKHGQTITVNTPTHIAGTIDFASGAIASLVTTFDVWGNSLPRIEVYGSDGTLSVPDPNIFGGPVRLRRPGEAEWNEVPLTHGYSENSRSLGVADMAYGLRTGRPHRANGELAFHVLDAMHAFLESSEKGRHVELKSTCERPAPLPTGLKPGRLDP